MASDDDIVSHPTHYTWLPGVECQKVVQHFNFNKGNALKYIWRSGKKSSDAELLDLKKARQYIDFEISRILIAGQELRKPKLCQHGIDLTEFVCGDCEAR